MSLDFLSKKEKLKIKRTMNVVLGEKKYLQVMYRHIFHEKLDLDNPQRFKEKLFWLKEYNGLYSRDLVQLCYDKYTVRKYLKDKKCESYLNELYGVYDNADEINFNDLPNDFILKITQSSGKNIVVQNKNNEDLESIRKKLNQWLEETNDAVSENPAMEEYYFTGKAKIICEKLLRDSEGNFPNDIRIFCFNGEPKIISCDIGTTTSDGCHGHDIIRNTYDLDWKLLPVDFGRSRDDNINIKKPENLSEMLDLSKKLSEDFLFARIDLFDIKDKIIFGEITWIPMGGHVVTEPVEYDYLFGKWLELPDVDMFKTKQ